MGVIHVDMMGCHTLPPKYTIFVNSVMVIYKIHSSVITVTTCMKSNIGMKYPSMISHKL